MTNNAKNIFISHIQKNDEGLKRLKHLLNSDHRVVREYSPNADNPNDVLNKEYVKNSILEPGIRASEVLIVYISSGIKDTEYINWTIKFAHQLDKRIVGIWALGENRFELSDELNKYADVVVVCNGDRILDAIDGRINDWENPDGSPYAQHNIDRHDCGKESEQ